MAGKIDNEVWSLPYKRDCFGLRTRRVHSPALMRDIADRLNAIAGERETEALRFYVEGVLQCPYWGLRVLAIRVYAAWGGRHNKAWLIQRATRKLSPDYRKDRQKHWHHLETMTARMALGPLLVANDGDWLLDAWFANGGRHFYCLAKGLTFIPEEVLLSRMSAEMTSTDPERRLGVLIMVSMLGNLPNRLEVSRILAKDANIEIRNYATTLLRHFLARQEELQSDVTSGKTSAKTNRLQTQKRSQMAMRQFRPRR